MILRPSGDIALFLDRLPQTLKLGLFDRGAWIAFDLKFDSLQPDGHPVVFTPAIDGSNLKELVPFGVGDVFAWATPHGAISPAIPVRIRVFEKFEELTLDPELCSLEEKTDSLVLTVRGQCVRGTDRLRADLSYPSLPDGYTGTAPSEGELLDAYQAHIPVPVSVSNGAPFDLDPKSLRVTAKAVNAPFLEGRVTVGSGASNQVSTIRVLKAGSRLVEPLYRATKTGARNLLVLSEGYLEAHQAQAREHALKLTRHLTTDCCVRPFDLLRERFNVWYRFEPSLQAGITMASPVCLDSRSRGLPLRSGFGDDPQAAAGFGVALNRLFPPPQRGSFFGFCLGERLGSGLTSSKQGDAQSAFYSQPDDARVIHVDPRRRPSASLSRPFDGYFASLKALNPSGAEYPLGDLAWTDGRADSGLVCFLAHETFQGGTMVPSQGYFAITVRSDTSYSIAGANRLVAPGDDRVETFMHEFGHALGLGDEYEGDGKLTHQPDPAIVTGQTRSSPNLDSLQRVGGGGSPAFGAVKWGMIPEPEDVARISSCRRDGPFYFLKVGSGTGAWPSDAKVFVTAKKLLDPSADYYQVIGPGKIAGTVGSGDDTELKVGFLFEGARTTGAGLSIDVGALGAGGWVLSARRTEAGSARYLLRGEVVDRLNTRGKPYGEYVADATAYSSAEYSDFDSAFDHLCYGYGTIAAFEGGNDDGRGVLRPAGLCKMRRSAHRKYCRVCEFHLIMNNDPFALVEWGKGL